MMDSKILVVRPASLDGMDRMSMLQMRDDILAGVQMGVLILGPDDTVEVRELPPLGGVEVVPGEMLSQSPAELVTAPPEGEPGAAEGEEKRAILRQLTNYRAVNGPGCLDAVARATRTKGRINSNTLRMLLVGDTKMPIDDWRKVGRALDKLERPADKAGVLAAPPKRRQGPGRGADGADADG